MMTKTHFNPSLELAWELDSKDELATYRERFVISDPDLLYFDGNSLGRLTKASLERAKQVVEEEWGKELIRGWNQGWWESTSRVGDKIGQLTGAAAGQVIVGDTTSINLFKLTLAALALLPDKMRIVTDTLNFPSDLYILQGCVQLLGHRHEILCIGSKDDDITPDLGALKEAINSDIALVTLSHVVFKSGYLYDMAAITEIAHRQGALILWDLSHSVGVLPIELDKSNVDFAVGCTYKYLNGGPGSPAFLYVNKSLQDKISSPIWGWWGQTKPFAFDLDYVPAQGVQRFQAGTQPMLSLLTMEAALDPLLEAGLDAIRTKSTLLTEYASYLTDQLLTPLGFSLGSPRDPARRGSHISLRHEEGYRINRALIDEMNLIPDFREPDNIRLGFAPLYTTFTEVWEGFDRIRRVVTEKRYEHFTMQKLTVT
jgi:kynureninase